MTTVDNSEPDFEEVEQALKYLGYAPNGRVAQAVHRVLDHERNNSGRAMSTGISDTIERARKARLEQKAPARVTWRSSRPS